MFFFAKTTMSGKTPTPEERAAHHAFLKENCERLLAAGPTFDEGANTPEGSIFVFEAENFQAAQEFIESDPFFIEGMRSKIEIFAWRPGGYARNFPVDPKDI